MDYIEHLKARERKDTRDIARKARAKRARIWARRVIMAMVVLGLFAIWQDRRLAPQVHDGMRSLAVFVQGSLDGQEKTSGWLKRALSSPTGATSIQQKHDPVTRWLLKWTS